MIYLLKNNIEFSKKILYYSYISMTDPRTNQGNTKESDIGKLIREGADNQTVLATLKDKYNDKELVAKAFAEYEERMDKIRRKAKKFAELVLTKYNHLGQKRVMEKALKLKKKYNFGEDDFAAFVAIALNNRGQLDTYNTPSTPLGKTFGYTSESAGKMSYKPTELPLLQDILKMHNDNLMLHQNIVTQSLIYRDCASEAITGRFKRDKHNAYNSVHPVVAALFLPRIKYIDEHMLIGSISNIVATRYNGSIIKNQPDYELYWDMIVDPNEVACADASTGSIQDLKSRVALQIELWKAVNNLRQGKYYDAEVASFMGAINNCKTNMFDSPDMANIKDEGTILRKLFGAFSLRPTIMSIAPLAASMSTNYSLNPLTLTQIITVPIINLRLPINVRGEVTVNLIEALEQPDMYVENKMIVTKLKTIIYSRDILVFYVNRKSQSLNHSRLVAPYNFTLLPTTYSGFETINAVNVAFAPIIPIGDDNFQLRSAVLLEKTTILNRNPTDITPADLIIGASAGIVIPRDFMTSRLEDTYLIYDPLYAAATHQLDSGLVVNDSAPITVVDRDTPIGNVGGIESFESRCRTRGTIYIYAKLANSRR
jgi:hypothetical protein